MKTNLVSNTNTQPIVGVFVSRKHIYDLHNMSTTNPSPHKYRFIELAKAAHDEQVTLYFFANNHVHLDRQKITGTYFHAGQHKWKQKSFPLPNVLYDRGGGGTPRKSMQLRKKFEERNIKKINSQHYFDKWDLYQQLSQLPSIKEYLPETARGEDSDKLLAILNKYGCVYVKARKGSCGKTVVKITKMNEHTYKYHYNFKSRLFSQEIPKHKLLPLIDSFFGRHQFIAQQPIDLLHKGDRIIDFRSEVLRSSQGKLMIYGTTARTGKPGSPIASNTYSTDYVPLSSFFRQHVQLNKQAQAKIRREINRFIIKIYVAIEKQYGSFGDLGIDFGIDRQGKLWLIECNAKSARVALFRAYGLSKVRHSFQETLKYARWLITKHHKEGES